MDESPVWFGLLNETHNLQGVKTVCMRNAGFEKLRFPVVITTLAMVPNLS